jgi:hypothetical protein
MGVDEARHYHTALRVEEANAGRSSPHFGGGADAGNDSIANRDAAILEDGLAIGVGDDAAVANQQIRRLLHGGRILAKAGG